MVRRWLFLLCLALLALICVATPALATYGPLWSQPVDGAARLVTGSNGATVVWAADEGGGVSALLAMRYSRAGAPLAASPQTLVSGIAELRGWAATGDGSRNVTVVWKDGGTISAARARMGGAAQYGPVVLCTDAAVAALRGVVGATAAPAQVVADADGGVFVRLTMSPSSAGGDTLLDYVSPSGAPAVTDPGLPVPDGTVADMTTDAVGHLFVTLVPPGRDGVAVQRYADDLAADWAAPVSPYNPLLGPPPAAVPEPIGIIATSSASLAWREGAKVRLQRFSATGSRAWPRPVSVSMSGEVNLAGDAYLGCYFVGPSGDGIVARHVLASGLEVNAPGSKLTGLGLAVPSIDGVSWNRAGDLSVAYGDGGGHSLGASGVARMTFLGTWTRAKFSAPPEPLADLGGDGAGGTYALGSGADATLRHVGQRGLSITFRPRITAIKYGQSVGVAGYLTRDGEPLTGRAVTLSATRGETSLRGRKTTTGSQGFYQATISPTANFTWSAEAAGAASGVQKIGVMPRLTLALSHSRANGRWFQHFSGKVTPAHRGSRVFVQRRSGAGWRTVRTGIIGARSRYSVTWMLPNRTASYTLRVVLPAHADHLQGASPTATLRVVVGKG
jgi:hypothetical protein